MDIAEVQVKIPTLEIFHRALQKNNFYMPDFSTGICTKEFMLRVKNREFWVPKYDEVSLRPCPQPPKKELLVDAILQRFKDLSWSETGWTAEVALLANKEWLVNVLSTVAPKHRYFQKDYLPTPEELRNIDQAQVIKRQVNNDDGFFTNLPNWTLKKGKSKRKSKIFSPAVVDDESLDDDKAEAQILELEKMRSQIKK